MDAVLTYCVLTSLSISRVGTCSQTGRASRSGRLLVMPRHGKPSSMASCPHSRFLLAGAFAGHCSAPKGQGSAGPSSCSMCAVPSSHHGTCSGHLLLPVSTASKLEHPWFTCHPILLAHLCPWNFFCCDFLLLCFGLWVLPSIWSHQLPSFRSAYAHFLKTKLLSFSFLSLSLFCLFLSLSVFS